MRLRPVLWCIPAVFFVVFSLAFVEPAEARRNKRDYKTNRLELTGLGGYQFGGQVDFEGGSASFDSGLAVGGLVGVQVREGARAVVGYKYQFSNADIYQERGNPEIQSVGMGIGYLQFGGELELDTGNRLAPIFGMTIGATHFTPEGSDAALDWFFSAVVYGALKIPLTRHFGLRGQFDFMVTVITNDSESLCVSGTGCVVALDVGAMVQGEIAGGAYLSF